MVNDVLSGRSENFQYFLFNRSDVGIYNENSLIDGNKFHLYSEK